MADKKKELVFCIINNGFSDLVMEAAKREGARGGTIFHARGTGNADIEKFFGISISPEKEVVLIVIDADIKDQVVSAIYFLAIPFRSRAEIDLISFPRDICPAVEFSVDTGIL